MVAKHLPGVLHCFEPACGPAAFLVSAMRLLEELLPASLPVSGEYLRQRLHGIDIDAFAIEIARLAMTLADIPNPDDWDVKCGAMFVGGMLEHLARRSMVLLANPPFSNFKQTDRKQYEQQGIELTYMNKATEMLSRTLPHLRPGAVFGVVVPQGFLYSKQAAELRASMARHFEIAEICLFPDKIFTFSDMESAILLGRRVRKPRLAAYRVRYRQVREFDVQRSWRLMWQPPTAGCRRCDLSPTRLRLCISPIWKKSGNGVGACRDSINSQFGFLRKHVRSVLFVV